jgi:hypothetical protein
MHGSSRLNTAIELGDAVREIRLAGYPVLERPSGPRAQ